MRFIGDIICIILLVLMPDVVLDKFKLYDSMQVIITKRGIEEA